MTGDSRDNDMRTMVDDFRRGSGRRRPVAMPVVRFPERRAMTVMAADSLNWLVHYWAGRYGSLGHLYSPSGSRRPMPHLPYAIDNGAYKCFTDGVEWSPEPFLRLVDRYAHESIKPLWVTVPDVVGDRDRTIERWHEWAPRLRSEFNVRLALAVQNGMVPADVNGLELLPDVIFVGGTTEWKWATVDVWATQFARVHVGRVNGARDLARCAGAGVESCDGTGWFHGRALQAIDLGEFLMWQSGFNELPAVHQMVNRTRTTGADQRHFKEFEV